MIGSRNRFRGRRDPRIVLKHGKSVRDGFLQIKYLNNKEGRDWRAAVAISTKVTKSAPKRNRIRRRIYEVLRENPPKSGSDLVVLAYDKNLAEIDHKKLKNSLLRLLDKAKLI